MKLMSASTHGYLDYISGMLIAASPRLFGFAKGSKAARYIPFVLGAGALIYSIFTKYAPGKFRVIPVKVHLLLDEMSGAFMAASPWLFGFSNKVKWPHVAMGMFEMAAAALTKRRSRFESA
jgi:hypothetical protein